MFENRKDNNKLICEYHYEDMETAADVCAAFIADGYNAKLSKVDNDEWLSMEWVRKNNEDQDHLASINRTGTRWNVTVTLTTHECVDLASSSILKKKGNYESDLRRKADKQKEMMQEINDLRHRLKKFEQVD